MRERKFVNWEGDGSGLANLLINNPPMNVMSIEVANEIKECVAEIAADRHVLVVVVTGAGERAFMAGADIRSFPKMMQNGGGRAIAEPVHKALNALEALPKPTIAAIHGYALGAGLELALACDIRIATENAQLGLPEIKLGLLPGGGATQRLPRMIGKARAKELIFTGESITAEDGLRLGLVNRVVPVGRDIEIAQDLAWTIAKRSGLALAFAKQAIDQGGRSMLEEGLRVELDCFDRAFQTHDATEGVDAFINKRIPQFTHR